MRRAALKEQKLALAEARLESIEPRDHEAPWAQGARQTALMRVRSMGLAHPRDEYWKYTRPDTLTATEAPEAAVHDTGGEPPVFDAIDRLKIVFVDGVFDADASDPLEMEGVTIVRLSDAMQEPGHWAQALYGVIEGQSHDPVQRPLAALNTAMASDGVAIHVAGKAPRPISLIYLHRETTSDAVLHNVVRVESGAELTLLENGPAAARFSKGLEVDVADGGAFHHVRAQGRDHERRAFTGVFAQLGAESTFKSFTLTVNGVLTRNEVVLRLNGDNSIAHVAGACLGDGADFHHDDTVFITHDAVGCESRQVFKKVLRNGATGVFQGKILVMDGAQKTDGYQISQSLLLDDDSQFYAKPELEIYADDVACSHGSTSGAIDEEGLFYLRSRGVPESEATDLMTLAFLAEALDEIEDEALTEDIRDRLAGWLARHRR